MIRLLALWLVFMAVVIFLVIFREERLAHLGKVPLGRLRRFWMRNERRRSPRYRIDWPVRYLRTANTNAHNPAAKSRDLSTTGAGLIIEERLEPDAMLQLELAIPGEDKPIAVSARVAWCRQVPMRSSQSLCQFFVGLEFQPVDAGQAQRIAQALGRRAGKVA